MADSIIEAVIQTNTIEADIVQQSINIDVVEYTIEADSIINEITAEIAQNIIEADIPNAVIIENLTISPPITRLSIVSQPSQAPTLYATQPTYKVYEYIYQWSTYYRRVYNTYSYSTDQIYSDNVLTTLVATRG